MEREKEGRETEDTGGFSKRKQRSCADKGRE
jgi:hypothetical protein